LRVF